MMVVPPLPIPEAVDVAGLVTPKAGTVVFVVLKVSIVVVPAPMPAIRGSDPTKSEGDVSAAPRPAPSLVLTTSPSIHCLLS